MIVSLDLGSRYCGVAILEDALPARVAAAVTLDVDPEDVTSTASSICGAIDLAVKESRARELSPPRVVIEWGRFYVPAKETPAKTAAAGAAMGQARDPMICIRDRVEQHARACPWPDGWMRPGWHPPLVAHGLEVIRIAARTWRGRIGCKGRDDAAVSLALATHGPTLADEHQNDAFGAALGVLIGERDAERGNRPGGIPRKRRGKRDPSQPRPLTPRQLKHRDQDAAMDALLEQGQARLALAAPAPAAPPPPMAEQIAAVSALAATRPLGYSGRRDSA